MKHLYLFVFCLLSSASLIAQNSALSFDGDSEFLSVPHNDDFNIGDGFTIEAWIFAEAWQPGQFQGSIVAKDNQDPDRGFAFRCGDNGILSFVMSVDNTWEEAFTGQLMNLNQWHHVAAVVDGGEIRLYIDGQPTASHSFSGNPSHSTDLPINIGASPGFGSRHFIGVLDEVRIWNDARSQSELLDNMTADLSGAEANLVAYFPMNEGMGTVTNDLSSNSSQAQFNDMDESNWVEGYTLPDFDVSVQDVFGVDVVNMIDRPIKLSTDVQNTGTSPISDIELELWLNGEFYITETITESIEPGDVFTHQFSVPLDLVGLTDPEIEVMASHPNDGNSLNNTGSLAVKTGSSDNIIISDMGFHNLGQQLNAIKMTLPNDLHRYEQILLNIDLACPAGGCGPWDVLADLKAITASGTYEIARYVTPYGIACGGWVVDITDFKSVLGGELEFQTNIIVYTNQGWLLDMSVDLIDNNITDTYTQLSDLWESPYHVYGDPGINDDLEPVTINFADNTESSHVRMTISGHGQGNTNNAAEFFEVNHNLNVDGAPFHNHHLWKADCASNPCDNQAGTWLFSRAGWCPGQEVIPYIIDTDGVTEAGGTISLDYELQDYTNLLNTGYDGSSHTEPYYRIYSYIIESSSTPYAEYRNLLAESVDASFSGNSLDGVTVSIGNDGFETLNGFMINIFHNNELIFSEDYNDEVAVGASVEKAIQINSQVDISESNVIFAEVINELDDNPGDNVVRNSLPTNTVDLKAEYPFELFPNPTIDGQVSLKYDAFWHGSFINIYANDGSRVQTLKVDGQNESLSLPSSGMYFYVVRHRDGYQLEGKITCIK